MDLICAVCEGLTEGAPSFFCDLCQKWFHHQCNLPFAIKPPRVSTCVNCNCDLFPFSICYDIDDKSFRFNYFHPSFSDLTTIEEIRETNTDYNLNTIDCRYLDSDDFNFAFSNTSSHLSFLHLNICSLPKYFDEYNNLLETINHEFKVLGISETRLTDSSIPHRLEIDGYKSLFTNTKASAGGTALFISNELRSKPRKDLSNLLNSERELESTFCELLFEKQENRFKLPV